jgi:hypothetical protein
MVQSLLGGHTPIACSAIGNAMSLIKDGKIRVLVITSKKRLEIAPEIPTLEEVGIKDPGGRDDDGRIRRGTTHQCIHARGAVLSPKPAGERQRRPYRRWRQQTLMSGHAPLGARHSRNRKHRFRGFVSGDRSAGDFAEILAPRPELRIPGTAAQTRIVSAG